ncbi:MAG: hypothetical protein AB1497_00875 [Bacillota bacterium]
MAASMNSGLSTRLIRAVMCSAREGHALKDSTRINRSSDRAVSVARDRRVLGTTKHTVVAGEA